MSKHYGHQPELNLDKELTRGNMKAAMKSAGASSRDLHQVPYAEIRIIESFNVRTPGPELDAHINSLVESILEEGYYQDSPLSGFIAVEDGHDVIYIYDGHCRYEAVGIAIERGAEIERLPVVINPGMTMEDLTVALARKASGKPLAPYELGIVCLRLQKMGRDEGAIAKRLGITEQYTKNLLSLMVAPSAIRKMVTSNQVSASVAIETIAKHKDKALDVLQRAHERASGAGKSKVTAKHIDPADKMKKAAKARYADMFASLSKVSGIEIPANGPIELPQALFDEIYTLVQKITESGS